MATAMSLCIVAFVYFQVFLLINSDHTPSHTPAVHSWYHSVVCSSVLVFLSQLVCPSVLCAETATHDCTAIIFNGQN